MKYPWAHLALVAGCTLPGLLPAQAAEPVPDPVAPQGIVVRMDVIQMSDDAAQKLAGKSHIQGGLSTKGEGVKLVHSSEMMVLLGRPGMFHLGHKNPIIYYDARASQFQVQYVDTGIKCDVKVLKRGDDDFAVEVHEELSVLDTMKTLGTPPSAAYPQTNVFNSQSLQTHVHYGESVIVGRVHGLGARQCLKAVGAASDGHPMSENLLMVFTLNRP